MRNHSDKVRDMARSVLPSTRNVNGARQVNGATHADMTQFIAELETSIPSSVRAITQPWMTRGRGARA